MWKGLCVVAVVAFLAMAAPAAAQDIPPTEDPADPSGCNEYHRMRDVLDSMGRTLPDDFQTGEVEASEPVVVDPIFDLIASQILWAGEVFPCK